MVANGLGARRENAGTKKSPQQIQMLENFYSGKYLEVFSFGCAVHFIVADICFYPDVQYPKPEEMGQYATCVGLTYSQVRIWFKERRRKERREMGTIGSPMERQLSARSSEPRSSSSSSSCDQTSMYGTSCSQPEFDSRSTSTVREQSTVQPQVLFPKDYILRKIFRKDGPPLGNEFDTLPQGERGRIRGMPVANEDYCLFVI